jgi:tetratricopeptide (TPR) repeat protein
MNANNESSAELKLRKVAFVAIPFGVKPTGVTGAKVPSHVDCDALWEKAIMPALASLDYLPIRADNQTGSVIIKDMLEQLVLADLVLADISIPNGNVYYEAGVRHAAQVSGCILLRASWSRPLFDLAQITQLTYSFPAGEPTDGDYQIVCNALVKGIPTLADAAGPVFTLVPTDEQAARDSRKLKEVYSDVFEFQTRLAAARLGAAAQRKSDLRSLISPDIVRRLPGYALRDLTVAVRDYLSWGELSALIDALPEKIMEDPFFSEQKAHALARQGRYYDAIGLLEKVIENHDATPHRCGTLGGRYRSLARDEPNRTRKRRYIGKAIDAYRRGMELDLNEPYCAQKLLITLMERGRKDDIAQAKRCAVMAELASSRAALLNLSEALMDSTRAVLAFYQQDAETARERVDEILDGAWTNWRLVELVQDLESLLTGIAEDKQAPFRELMREITEALPVRQQTLMDQVLPMIREQSCRYRKFQQVHARPAAVGEVIVSTTSDGEETTKTASAEDYVVKNLTEAREQYLVGKSKFETRYVFLEAVDDRWGLFDPVGEVLGTEITRDLTVMLGVGGEFFIMAPWGSEQLAREGDMLVAPLPSLDEVYRMARKEFDETYKLAEGTAK